MTDSKYHILHRKFKDHDSPSVEGQIRWLQKQGFAEHHIQQAMIALYNDIEQEKIPNLHTHQSHTDDEGQTYWHAVDELEADSINGVRANLAQLRNDHHAWVGTPPAPQGNRSSQMPDAKI